MGRPPLVILLRMRPDTEPTTTLTARAAIYAHVADGDREDFWETRQVPKVPEFSPFWGESLGALRRSHNADFTGAPCFNLAEGGAPPRIILLSVRMGAVLMATLSGRSSIHEQIAEGARGIS